MSDVFSQSAAVQEMAAHWPLITALMGGTSAMRRAAKTFLPQWPNESDDSYDARLQVATLFPAFQRTVEVLSGKPFSKPLTIGDDVPARIKAWTEDIDLQGRNLHVFAAGLCEEAVGPGFGGILVDFPRAEGLRTAAEEAAAGVRPYFVQVRPGSILGARSTRINGAEVLTQLRILETVTEPDGEFGEVTVEQVRVLYPGRWEIWRKVKTRGRNGVAIHDQGTTTLNKIPFVPFYGKRLGFMRGQPPLLELAHMNVEHWQSKSDQQTILHVARVPILAVTGVDDDKWELTVGASTAVKLPLEGDMKFVEHSGAAIEAGRMSILDLEDRMRQAGAELLVIKPGNTTEVQTLADNEQGMCALQRIVQDLEDAIDAALQLAAEWIGEKQGGHVTIYKDFGAATLAEASAELLLKTGQAGKLSDETLFSELQRRGILSPDLNYEDEKERIESQGPALGTMTTPANGNN
jgi:hypothetical protein